MFCICVSPQSQPEWTRRVSTEAPSLWFCSSCRRCEAEWNHSTQQKKERVLEFLFPADENPVAFPPNQTTSQSFVPTHVALAAQCLASFYSFLLPFFPPKVQRHARPVSITSEHDSMQCAHGQERLLYRSAWRCAETKCVSCYNSCSTPSTEETKGTLIVLDSTVCHVLFQIESTF